MSLHLHYSKAGSRISGLPSFQFWRQANKAQAVLLPWVAGVKKLLSVRVAQLEALASPSRHASLMLIKQGCLTMVTDSESKVVSARREGLKEAFMPCGRPILWVGQAARDSRFCLSNTHAHGQAHHCESLLKSLQSSLKTFLPFLPPLSHPSSLFLFLALWLRLP